MIGEILELISYIYFSATTIYLPLALIKQDSLDLWMQCFSRITTQPLGQLEIKSDNIINTNVWWRQKKNVAYIIYRWFQK